MDHRDFRSELASHLAWLVRTFSSIALATAFVVLGANIRACAQSANPDSWTPLVYTNFDAIVLDDGAAYYRAMWPEMDFQAQVRPKFEGHVVIRRPHITQVFSAFAMEAACQTFTATNGNQVLKCPAKLFSFPNEGNGKIWQINPTDICVVSVNNGPPSGDTGTYFKLDAPHKMMLIEAVVKGVRQDQCAATIALGDG